MPPDGDFPPPGDFDGPPPFDEPPPQQQMQNGQNGATAPTEIQMTNNGNGGEYADAEIAEETDGQADGQEVQAEEQAEEEKPAEEPEKQRDAFVPFDESNMDVSNFDEDESDIIKKLFENNPFGTPPISVSGNKKDEKKTNGLELGAIYCVNNKWFFSVYDTKAKKSYTLELRGKTSEKVPYSVEFFDDETNSISITSALSTQVLTLRKRSAPPKTAAKPQAQQAQAANQNAAAKVQQQAAAQKPGNNQSPGENVRTVRANRGNNQNNQQQGRR